MTVIRVRYSRVCPHAIRSPRLARIGLLADFFDRTDPGEGVQDQALQGARIADLMPVPARDDKDMPG